MLFDLKYALRQILKHKGVTVAVAASLALCIGMNAVIFSLLYAIVLQPPPFRQSHQLVEIYNSFAKLGARHSQGTIEQYLDYAGHPELFAGAALYNRINLTVGSDSGPARMFGVQITPGFFGMLGVNPVVGRFFPADAIEPGKNQMVILSEPFWRAQYHSDPGAIGQELTINEKPYVIVGVVPAAVGYLAWQPELFVPLTWSPHDFDDLSRANTAMAAGRLLARLQPGISYAQAVAQLHGIDKTAYDHGSARYQRSVDSSGYQSVVAGLQDSQTASQRDTLYLLQCGALLVLLIGCVNVANLMLARATARQSEISIRYALGGSRWHIVRQMMTEALLLSLLGGVLGAGIAAAGVGMASRFAGNLLNTGTPFSVDPRLFATALGISLVAGLAVGAFPSFRAARGDLLAGIQQSSRSASSGRRSRRFGSLLASAQVCFSLMLLAGSGLLARSLINVLGVPTGIDVSELTHARIALTDPSYRDPAVATRLRVRIVDALEGIPGVETVGASNYIPMQSEYRLVDIYIRGAGGGIESAHPLAGFMSVSREYFPALGVRLVAGRLFDARDTSVSAQSIIIDQRMAERCFPHEDPIGRQLAAYAPPTRDNQWATVIGVVATVPYTGLEDLRGISFVYLPMDRFGVNGTSFFVRSRRPATELAPLIRERIHAIAPAIAVYNLMSMENLIYGSLEGRRSLLAMLGAFASVALILSAIGIYSVLAYDVSRRTREIGIRGAIGASRPQIIQLILSQGLLSTGIGLIFGLIGAIWLGRLMSGMLFQVSPSDPPTLLIISLTLLVTGVIASLVPAWRAARIDPIVALHCE
jgi:putative ABC transport system permease protein